MAKSLKKKITTRKKVPLSREGGKKWVLAIDPFSDLSLESLKEFALPLAQAHKAKLIVVYVLAPASFNWTGDFSGPWISKYKPLSEEKLNQSFMDHPEVQKIVLTCRKAGLRESARTLLTFARKCKAERVILATHARHGVERWAMGSFAETVILSAKVPVMVVNPSHHLPQVVHRILVPTDLTPPSQRHALETAEVARNIDAEIVLFYKQPDPLDPIIQQGVYSLGGGWVSVQSFIEEEMAAKDKALLDLENRIAKKGVSVRHLVDTSPESLVDSINSAVRSTSADMVSVLTRTGSVAATLLGSVARGLVRSSAVPLLVRRGVL